MGQKTADHQGNTEDLSITLMMGAGLEWPGVTKKSNADWNLPKGVLEIPQTCGIKTCDQMRLKYNFLAIKDNIWPYTSHHAGHNWGKIDASLHALVRDLAIAIWQLSVSFMTESPAQITIAVENHTKTKMVAEIRKVRQDITIMPALIPWTFS